MLCHNDTGLYSPGTAYPCMFMLEGISAAMKTKYQCTTMVTYLELMAYSSSFPALLFNSSRWSLACLMFAYTCRPKKKKKKKQKHVRKNLIRYCMCYAFTLQLDMTPLLIIGKKVRTATHNPTHAHTPQLHFCAFYQTPAFPDQP